MAAKIFAIIFIYAAQFNFGFGFKIKNSRLPLFYLLIIPIAFAGFIINRNYQDTNYLLVFFTGVGFWLLALLATHQLKLIVEKTDAQIINKTIVVFFIINAVISVLNIAFIIWKTRSINPYTYRGMYQLYFINTGDNIKGITFDISSTNAVLSALGIIYFLTKKNIVMLLVCMVTMLLTYSNLITLMLLFIMLLLFIFKSSAVQKSMIVICLMLYLVFMVKISPQNLDYVNEVVQRTFHIKKPVDNKIQTSVIPIRERPDSLLDTDGKKRKIALLYLDSVNLVFFKQKYARQLRLGLPIPIVNKKRPYIIKPDTNTEQFYPSKEIEPDRKLMLDFIGTHTASLPMSSAQNSGAPALPGKLTGMIQTPVFLYHHPINMLAGLGIGNFSSKIAFRATGLGIRGRYPEKHAYISKAFLSNHLDLYMSFFSKEVSFRSVTNNPFSVYDQLLAEYGLLGILALIIFYFGFFIKQYTVLTYGIPMLLFVMAIFFIDYWFEQLSVMVLFELMLFLNIKEGENLKPGHAN